MIRRIWILLLIMCNSLLLFAQQYHIGDVITNPDGSKGIVFYINPEGTGGWMVKLTDDSGGCKWGTNGDISGLSNYASPTNTQEQLTHLDGYQNTQIIRNFQNNNTTYAAGKVDFNHGWYLPSLGQLRILISKLGLIKTALTSNGGAVLNNDKLYWSSTECSSSEAWCIKMSNTYNGAVSGGYYNKGSKSSNNAVRAIRDFTMSGGSNGATYIWSENHVVIPNATGNEITVSPTGTTTYSVEVSYYGSCSGGDEVTITVNPILTGSHSVTICENELPYIWPGYNVTFNTAGSQTVNVPNGTACDSVVTLTVNVDQIPTGSHSLTICESELPYLWPGYNVTFNTAGSQTVNVPNGTACDSVVTLTVNVDQIPSGNHTVTICENELPYIWPGYNVTFNTAGSQTVNVPSGTACDSVVTLTVNVDQIPTGSHSVTICESGLPYIWPGYNVTFNAGGSQTVNVPSGTACDSVVTLV